MDANTTTAVQHRFIGLFFIVAAAFAFSAKAVFVKLAYGYGIQVSPIILLALRMVLSLPFFIAALLFIERNRDHAPLSGGDRLRLLGLGIIGYYVASYFDFVGLSYISASLERLVLLLYPTLVVLISALLFRRAITRKEAVALIISYVGIIIVYAEELTLDGANVMLGTAFIFGSALAYALYLIGSGVMVTRIGSMRFTAYVMTIACLATLLHFALAFDVAIIELPKEVYGLALLIAIVSTVIPTFLMSAGIQRIGANTASIVSSIGPIMTIFLAYIFLGEALSSIQFIGAVLVMVGVYVISSRTTK